MHFDGNQDFITRANIPAGQLPADSDFSMEAWFTTPGTGPCNNNFRRLLTLANPDRFEVGECGGNLVIFWLNASGTANGPFTIPAAVGGNAWHHLSVTREGDVVRVYLDCTLVFLRDAVGTLSTNLFRVGHWGGGATPGQDWLGFVDDIRLWNYARSAAEIQQSCTCTLQGTETGLLAYWKLDQGVPNGNNTGITLATDSSPNGNNGTLNPLASGGFALTGNTSNFVCSGSPLLYADFNFSALNNCTSIQFLDNSTGSAAGYSLFWEFPNGGSSSDPNPVFDFPGCGDYEVCLTISTPDCSDKICKTISIIDNTPPTAKCIGGIGVVLNANCTVTVGRGLFDGGSTDNCQIASLSVSPNTFTQCGVFPVTLMVTDVCGNTSTCNDEVQVIESVPPIIMCPPNQSITCDDNTDPAATGYASATDNCDSDPVVDYTDQISGPMPCDGTIVRTWTATDACGNVSSCLQTITVHDNVPPILTNCPQNISVTGALDPAGQCIAQIQVNSPTATDNCDPNVTLSNSFNNTANASGTYTSGTTVVTWTATDDCGNKVTCSFSVTVVCDMMPQDTVCGWTVGTLYGNGSADQVAILYDTRFNSTALPGSDWGATMPNKKPVGWTLGKVGNVFGIALDNNSQIYLAATDVYHYDAPWLNSTAGPAGPGGIYKTDFNLLVPNAIVNTLNSATLCPVGGNMIPNKGGNGNGIGNIAFDPVNNQLFATNLEDGRIYRMDLNGNIKSAFDPFNLDSGIDGLEEIPAERIWGIGVFTESGTTRVYFAREFSGTNSKQIWSIALTGSGEFAAAPVGSCTNLYQGAEVLEINNVLGTLEKITDIAFAADGHMLLAERGAPHNAGVFEYKKTSGWNFVKKYFLGVIGAGDNSAGGVDYGYKEINGNPTAECDGLVWATGNCLDALLVPGGGCEVYGFEGMSSSGNAIYPSNAATDIFVDHDQVYGGGVKYQIGEVEVFKCGCAGASSVCDSISVTSTPSMTQNDSCCFVLNVQNQKPNYFTGIALCAQSGVSISSISALNGWSIAGYSASMVSIAPPTGDIPVTAGQDFFKFCLSNYQNIPTQQIIVKYYGPDFSVVCTDTLNYECTQKPKCIKVVNDTVTCAPNGQYMVDFCIMSNALIGWNVSSIQLNAPAGITLTPSVFPVSPALLPGGMQCGFSTLVSGALDGQQICFSVTAHKQDISNGEVPLDCCTDTVMLVCVTMPDCICNNVSASYEPVASPGDTCCWKVNLTNNYSNTFFTGVQLNILTSGVVFGSIQNYFGSGWNLAYGPTQATFTKIPPGGTTIGASAKLPVFCLSGIHSPLQVPQTVVLSWLGPNGQVVCTDTLVFDCEPPVNGPCALLLDPVILCDSISGSYTLSFQVQNTSSFTANQVVFNLISPPFAIVPSQFNIPPLLPGGTSAVITTTVYGAAGAPICFNLTLHELGASGEELNCCTNPTQICFTLPKCPDSCSCLGFSNLAFSNIPGIPDLQVSCNNQPALTLPCIPTDDLYHFQGNMICPDSCSQMVDYQMIGNGQVIFSGSVPLFNSTNFFQIPGFSYQSFPGPGNYQLVLTGYCGDDTCICPINLVVPPCMSACHCGTFSDMSYRPLPGVPNIPIACGDTLNSHCDSGSPLQISGNFLCQGDNCTPDVPMYWSLTGPDAPQSGLVYAVPGFQITLPANYFNTAGAYQLTLQAICGQDTCECTFIILSDGCPPPCCAEESVFDSLLAIGFTVVQIGCSITVTAPQFDSCYLFSSPPYLVGGPPVLQVIVPTTGSWVFNFSNSGTYTICVNVFDDCNFKLMCTTVDVVCDTLCHCGGFSDMSYRVFPGVPNLPVACGDSIAANCAQGAVFQLSGNFGCLGTDCLQDNQISWSLQGPGVSLGSSTVASPGFSISLNPNVFSTAGIYQLSFYGICGLDTCFCAITIVSDGCDTCHCGMFEKIKVVNKKTGFSQSLSCDNPPLDISCPPPGKPYKITGKLVCDPATCAGTSLVWEIKKGAMVVGSGSQPGPWFSIPMNQATFSQGDGLYTVTLTGICGNDTCSCTLNFNVTGCANPDCPCDDAFYQSVMAGFSYTYDFDQGTCKWLFKPNKANDCDKVDWTILLGTGTVATGTTLSNQPFTHVFPNGSIGTYTICMRVYRLNPDGTVACEKTFKQTVNINCIIVGGACSGNILTNPGFDQNAQTGILGSGGVSEGWTNRAGSPRIAAAGSLEPFSVTLSGKCLPIIDILDHPIPLDPKPRGRMMLWYQAYASDLQPGTELVIRISESPLGIPDCNMGCYEIGRIPISATGDNWNAAGSSFELPSLSGNYYLSLLVENDLAYDDPDAASIVSVDNLCIEQSDSIFTGTHNNGAENWSMRIVPNPNDGRFSVNLSQTAAPDWHFRILDLTGRLVQEERAAPGLLRQSIDTQQLPAGLYFLQLVSDGRLLATSRFVKQ
ncbi:MAG: T9SS type A sorting domain-containing protein [Lewinellaceae bacterium]|nr:T9SS type A sorting domain-containing protein [Lewinellaceae bacterium]